LRVTTQQNSKNHQHLNVTTCSLIKRKRRDQIAPLGFNITELYCGVWLDDSEVDELDASEFELDELVLSLLLPTPLLSDVPEPVVD
jgi:hypothetical protein